MSDEKKSVSESLREWGIDIEKFEVRARESFEAARGDLSEIKGTLRETLLRAKDVVSNLPKTGPPAAAELRAGFERAWKEIDQAIAAAREKAREARQTPDEPPPDEPSPQ